jgi:hypothetical protein
MCASFRFACSNSICFALFPDFFPDVSILEQVAKKCADVSRKYIYMYVGITILFKYLALLLKKVLLKKGSLFWSFTV